MNLATSMFFRDASSGFASFNQNGQTARATTAFLKHRIFFRDASRNMLILMSFEPDAKLMINLLGMSRGFWPLLTQNGQNDRSISKFQSKTYGPQLPQGRPQVDVFGGVVGRMILIEISSCFEHFANLGSNVAKTLGTSPKKLIISLAAGSKVIKHDHIA